MHGDPDPSDRVDQDPDGDPDMIVTDAGDHTVSILMNRLVLLTQCPADFNGDRVVDCADIVIILDAWGFCDDCPEDLNQDGMVDIDDLFAVLAAWGPCP